MFLPTNLDWRNGPKDVVVTRRGVVAEDDRKGIEEERAEVEDPAANPLPGAPASSCRAAVGLVAGDHAGLHRGGRGGLVSFIIKNTPALAVAAGAAIRAAATDGIIRCDDGTANRQDGLTGTAERGVVETATFAVAAAAPDAAGTGSTPPPPPA